MVIPRHPHTPAEFTLEIKVDAEGIRMEIILSQPAPPQCDPLPRRATSNTGSEEPGTPPRSPAIGTGLDGPGVSRIETSTEEKRVFPLETSMNGFLRSNCTSAEQEYVMLHQPDVGVNDEKETTFTTSRCSRRVAESYEEATAARDDSLDYQAEQAFSTIRM